MIKLIRKQNGKVNMVVDFEVKDGKIFGQYFPGKDLEIVTFLLKNDNQPKSTWDIMLGISDNYVQHIQTRVKFLVEKGVLTKPEWGKFQVAPHMIEMLKTALSEGIINEKELLEDDLNENT